MPATPFVGSAIKAEIGVDTIDSISDVPGRSLLSRLTDHYFQIVATRAPVGFEAEFVNQRGQDLCYRGILMPFSSDGDTIDYVYGVISWKVKDGAGEQQVPLHAILPPIIADTEDERQILDRMRAEVLDRLGVEVLNRWKFAALEQRHPVIIGADVHPALIGADCRRRIDRRAERLGRPVECSRISGIAFHARCAPISLQIGTNLRRTG
jgi:hypothetical protein